LLKRIKTVGYRYAILTNYFYPLSKALGFTIGIDSMASNKNQHYVPQCYLRRFSSAESGAAISLFNLDREKLIENAPIKNQCSKGYFYGDDLVIEKDLQPIEGEYSAVINQIIEPGYKLSEEHKIFLKRFWLLQNMRTDAASKRSVEMSDEMGVVAGIDPSVYRQELKDAVIQSMKIFYEHIDMVDDLKVCLIKNKTNNEFITSDDPAVLSNKWHILKKSSSGLSFGLGSAGNIILLPLTPNILCLGYDGDVYSVRHNNGWVDVKDKSDIRSLNEHQFLNCRANIYTHKSNIENELISDYAKIVSRKPILRHNITYSVLDRVDNGFKRYKVIDKKEAGDHNKALMHCQMIYPKPSLWPKQIGWRNKGFVFSNGSGVGYIRRSRIGTMTGEKFRKMRA